MRTKICKSVSTNAQNVMFYMLTSLQNSDKWQNRKHANSNLTLRKKLSALGCNDAEKRLKQDNIMINMVKIIIIRL